MIPNLDSLKRQFQYKNGGLYRNSSGNRSYIRPDGYAYTRLDGRQYGEHRLIHFIFTGEWPHQVDHINGIRNDNRPENLRSATNAQNSMNRRNTPGLHKGCYWVPKREKWMVQIGLNGKRKTVGYFSDLDSATMAYKLEAIRLFGEFASTGPT